MTDFRTVRRQDRLLNTPEAMRLLERGEYGFLAMCSLEGYGYGIPISYVYISALSPEDGPGCVYFHCASEGHKLDSIRQNDRVSLCVVGETKVLPYTTAYESVHVFGRIAVVSGVDERQKALLLLRSKYNPELGSELDAYMLKSMPRTVVLRLNIEHLSGKCKPLCTCK